MAQQGFNISAVFGICAHANAGIGQGHDAVDAERLCNGVEQMPCQLGNLRLCAAGHEDHELIAGQAADDVLRPGALRQPVCNLTQQGIARTMTHAVIPVFEAIQIQIKEQALLAACRVQCLLRTFIEHGAIRQTCERVVIGQLPDTLLAGIALHGDGRQVQKALTSCWCNAWGARGASKYSANVPITWLSWFLTGQDQQARNPAARNGAAYKRQLGSLDKS